MEEKMYSAGMSGHVRSIFIRTLILTFVGNILSEIFLDTSGAFTFVLAIIISIVYEVLNSPQLTVKQKGISYIIGTKPPVFYSYADYYISAEKGKKRLIVEKRIGDFKVTYKFDKFENKTFGEMVRRATEYQSAFFINRMSSNQSQPRTATNIFGTSVITDNDYSKNNPYSKNYKKRKTEPAKQMTVDDVVDAAMSKLTTNTTAAATSKPATETTATAASKPAAETTAAAASKPTTDTAATATSKPISQATTETPKLSFETSVTKTNEIFTSTVSTAATTPIADIPNSVSTPEKPPKTLSRKAEASTIPESSNKNDILTVKPVVDKATDPIIIEGLAASFDRDIPSDYNKIPELAKFDESLYQYIHDFDMKKPPARSDAKPMNQVDDSQSVTKKVFYYPRRAVAEAAERGTVLGVLYILFGTVALYLVSALLLSQIYIPVINVIGLVPAFAVVGIIIAVIYAIANSGKTRNLFSKLEITDSQLIIDNRKFKFAEMRNMNFTPVNNTAGIRQVRFTCGGRNESYNVGPCAKPSGRSDAYFSRYMELCRLLGEKGFKPSV